MANIIRPSRIPDGMRGLWPRLRSAAPSRIYTGLPLYSNSGAGGKRRHISTLVASLPYQQPNSLRRTSFILSPRIRSKLCQTRSIAIMSLPQTYRQAVFKAKGQPLVVEETPMKLPRDGEVLVKVEACGVCYADMFSQRNAMGGGFPMVPGHEIIGRVAAVGNNVQHWKAGDRIGAGWHGGQDDTCKACKKGWKQMCEKQVINGATKNGGCKSYSRKLDPGVMLIIGVPPFCCQMRNTAFSELKPRPTFPSTSTLPSTHPSSVPA